VGYEKAGLSLADEPVPWNAEAAWIDADFRFPQTVPHQKIDFDLRIAGHSALGPQEFARLDEPLLFRARFCLRSVSRPLAAEVRWRNHRLGQLTVPFLGRDDFLAGLRLEMPTVFAHVGEHCVACRTFVGSQCKGLFAAAVLTGRTSLVPLVDSSLAVQIRADRGTWQKTIPVRLPVSHLTGRQALISIPPQRLPRKSGALSVSWNLGERMLDSQRVRAISLQHFFRSLSVRDLRFVVQPHEGQVKICRTLPPFEEIERAGPCFVLKSEEPAVAGLAPLEIRMHKASSSASTVLFADKVLLTDGPTMLAPGTVDMQDQDGLASFQLFLRGRCLGSLSTQPFPAAVLTTEGGIKETPEFSWSRAAEEELIERLNQLLADPIPHRES
jgi:hypothetical protein